MSEQGPTIVLVHGALAESASWNRVIERLHHRSTMPDTSHHWPVTDALARCPVTSSGDELAITGARFHHQFAADVPAEQTALMAATQRTHAALTQGLPTDTPAWRHVPSWFVFGDRDRYIPVALHRFMSEAPAPPDRPWTH